MSVYFIANIKIDDPQTYEKYLEGCNDIFNQYNGEYLAVDERPILLEGNWNYTKVVLIRFPSDADLRRWYESEDYQKLLKFRLASAQCDTIIINGIS